MNNGTSFPWGKAARTGVDQPPSNYAKVKGEKKYTSAPIAYSGTTVLLPPF